MNCFKVRVLLLASSDFFDPSMVNVFPDPVWPYINTVPFIPDMDDIIRSDCITSITFDWLLKDVEVVLFSIIAAIKLVAEGLACFRQKTIHSFLGLDQIFEYPTVQLNCVLLNLKGRFPGIHNLLFYHRPHSQTHAYVFHPNKVVCINNTILMKLNFYAQY